MIDEVIKRLRQRETDRQGHRSEVDGKRQGYRGWNRQKEIYMQTEAYKVTEEVKYKKKIKNVYVHDVHLCMH